jgi:restriction system protein
MGDGLGIPLRLGSIETKGVHVARRSKTSPLGDVFNLVAVFLWWVGVVAAKGAASGLVVTSGQFTANAQEFARGRNVTLLDGEKLFAMLHAAMAKIKKGAPAVGVPVVPGAPAPACPACGSTLIKRQAKRGGNAGNAFWGCSTYPKCRGTVQL